MNNPNLKYANDVREQDAQSEVGRCGPPSERELLGAILSALVGIGELLESQACNVTANKRREARRQILEKLYPPAASE
jgi:hypothetical protein